MRLRSTTSLPGRYQEDHNLDHPGRASSARPTTPYNPDLPPAAFPTLDYPPPVDFQTDDRLQQEIVTKKAIVFHGSNDLTNMLMSEELNILELEPREFAEWTSTKDLTEPDEYDGWQTMANSIDTPRTGLSAYDLTQGWSQVNAGMKLIVFKEIMTTHTFDQAVKKLMLTEKERNTVINLFQEETARQVEEKMKIARVQASQLRIMMIDESESQSSREALSESFGDLFTNIKVPATFRVSKADIEHARRVLIARKLNEFVGRLWRYEGIALDSVDWNISLPEEQSLHIVEIAQLEENQHQDPLTSGDIEAGPNISLKKIRKGALGNLGATPSRRRIRVQASGPSRLRNSVSRDARETVAVGPTASRTTFLLHKQLAPQTLLQTPLHTSLQTPQQSRIKKQYTVPSFGPVMNSSPESLQFDTPSGHSSDQTKQTMDSRQAGEREQSLFMSQGESSHLMPLEGTPSQKPRLRFKPTTPTKELLIPEQESNGAIAPSTETSPMTAAKTTNSWEREESDQDEHAEQSFSGSANELESDTEGEALPKPRRKRKRGGSEDGWRASGERKPKYPVQNARPKGQKRRAVKRSCRKDDHTT